MGFSSGLLSEYLSSNFTSPLVTIQHRSGPRYFLPSSCDWTQTDFNPVERVLLLRVLLVYLFLALRSLTYLVRPLPFIQPRTETGTLFSVVKIRIQRSRRFISIILKDDPIISSIPGLRLESYSGPGLFSDDTRTLHTTRLGPYDVSGNRNPTSVFPRRLQTFGPVRVRRETFHPVTLPTSLLIPRPGTIHT